MLQSLKILTERIEKIENYFDKIDFNAPSATVAVVYILNPIMLQAEILSAVSNKGGVKSVNDLANRLRLSPEVFIPIQEDIEKHHKEAASFVKQVIALSDRFEAKTKSDETVHKIQTESYDEHIYHKLLEDMGIIMKQTENENPPILPLHSAKQKQVQITQLKKSGDENVSSKRTTLTSNASKKTW